MTGKGFRVLVPMIVALMFFMAGCVPTLTPKPATSSPTKGKDVRAISVVQKLRTEAVSRRIGRWAVVIGISDYKYDTRWNRKNGIPDLRFADRDAEAFARFLLSPEGGAFRPDHVLLLTNRKATVKEVRKAIGDFLARSLEDDVVILFYAGHGTPDPKNPDNLYLLCYDTEPGNYYGTALPMWEIDVALKRTIKSKRVLVLADACHSAGVGGTRGGPVSGRFNEYMERLAGSREGVTKVTASRADELSQERADLAGGHGVFTYYLLKGLEGPADEDMDGFVTMKEAYDYLYDRVRSDTRHSQNPWVSAYLNADIPLGIVDKQVLAAIEARSESNKINTATPLRPAPPEPASLDIPKDSKVAVKLARAKMAKGEIGYAREIIAEVIKRDDTAKPDALALKIALLLRDRDLKGAEDTEDLLVIAYPEHPAAEKGARLVYDYYRKEAPDGSPLEQIRQIEAYLKRHPGGLLEKEAKGKLKGIQAGVRKRYEKRFRESLTLAKGFVRQNRFERARKELNKARSLAKEAYSGYGVTLDTGPIGEIQVEVQRAEQKYRDRVFKEQFGKAKEQFAAGYYTMAYASLEKARKYGTPAQLAEVKDLALQYNEPPKVEIVLKDTTVDWETPVTFTYKATDRENDAVRVVSWDFGDGKTAKEDAPTHAYGKWPGSDKERRYVVTLKTTDGHTEVLSRKPIAVRKQDRIKVFTVNGVSFKMVRIKPGEFMMGSPPSEEVRESDETQHLVRITRGFRLGETEVTQGLWKAVMGTNPSYFENCGDDCPVERVSWNDAREFIGKLNALVPGGQFRLPTEAEWEYAARAGTRTRFCFGDEEGTLGDYAWYNKNAGGKTHPVAGKQPNAWGLYDMHGNVWEWCGDWSGKDYYSRSPRRNPPGPSSGSLRVLRGGSWGSDPWDVRAANRDGINPVYRDQWIGFRLALPQVSRVSR